MSLREELQERADKLDAELLRLSGRIREIEIESDEVHTCINALDIAEMDAADDELLNDALEAPAQPLPSVEGVTVTPATEEESGGPIIDAQTCEPIDPHVSWEPPPPTEAEPDLLVDAGGYAPVTDGDYVEHISVLTGDPAVEPESGLHGEPVSVLDDPELQAAVGRAQATLVDAELDADLDRVREQERAEKPEQPKRHAFWPFVGKLEDA